jgi:signal peptidase II
MQSARGASLTGADHQGHEDHLAPSPRRSPWPLLLGTAGAVLALDQATKYLAVRHLTGALPIELLNGLLTLRLVRNPGAAFGLASGFTLVFPLVAIVVCVLILRSARRLRSRSWTVGLALLLGGAMGNLLDRLTRSPGGLRGHVVDFLELPHWPVFNVADMSIVCAAVLLTVLSGRGQRLDGTRAAVEPVAATGGPHHQSSEHKSSDQGNAGA